MRTLTICFSLFAWASTSIAQTELWKDPSKPFENRAADLISKMTLDEKVSQMMNDAPAINRLGIPSYNWWNEALHGVARSGRATVFPQAIGMGATFDQELLFRVSTAISDEARAKYNEAQRIGNYGIYAGLTFWSPNVNLFRDPRWGRGQETYGEDPYLTGALGLAFVKGLQGNNPHYLKAAACAKHFAVHSGPEALRHEYNAVAPLKDFYETYTPAFKKLVQQGHVEAVMCAYNRIYGEPCCGSKFLLMDLLRYQWGFNGHIVTDCGAVTDFHVGHKVTGNEMESSVKAVKNGVNLDCGTEFKTLADAVRKGLISEARIDSALKTLLITRFKLGLFDPKGSNPYDNIDLSVVNSQAHRDLAREAAQKSIVLLKNDKGILPLRKDLHSISLLGPYAASQDVLFGNYSAISGNLTTVVEGIMREVSPATSIEYRMGILPHAANTNDVDWTTGGAHACDAIVVVMGVSGNDEGEEGESLASPTRGDRLDIRLPAHQLEYLKKLRKAGSKPIILVLTGGSPICSPEIMELADAVLFAWYPGEEGGNAVADVLFGNVAPSGRLPITFPMSVSQLPAFDDYSMANRGYRYMQGDPLFPFGFGLSYTTFEYSNLTLSKQKVGAKDSLIAEVMVTNTGKVAAEEVTQLYITHEQTKLVAPNYALKGFKRVSLKPGESTKVSYTINPEMLVLYSEQGNQVVEPGKVRVTIGGSSPMPRSYVLGASKAAVAEFIRTKK